MEKKELLFEIGCEELPASSLERLSQALEKNICSELNNIGLNFESSKRFATPRRLAVIVNSLDVQQQNRTLERHGPYLKDAYDKSGTPTLSCIGFAKSCDVSVDQLKTQETEKGERLFVQIKKPGLPTIEILPDIIQKAIKKLPIPKPMRWGDNQNVFLRPVHWVILIFGNDVVPTTFFGKHTTNETRGHRFHHPTTIMINQARDYNALLYSPGYVAADFLARKAQIKKMIEKEAGKDKAIINEKLLNEVTGLVEWPVILKGTFNKDYLKLPREVLITSMESHQKCFAIESSQERLQPCFILVSNIESKDPSTVIKGNERVINARLADAKFFYDNDLKQPLESHIPTLEKMIFQKKLGTLADKIKHIEKLTNFLAKKIELSNSADAARAAKLCKCDLASQMVFEFPSLQGTMGGYYAKNDGETNGCALAIKQHYYPRFSGDLLPDSNEACAVAIADRIDTLVGILGINQIPTGVKDPFALRRAALAITRICIEKKLSLSLVDLIKKSASLYSDLPNKDVGNATLNFIMDRLRYWLIEQGVSVEVIDSVAATETHDLLDFYNRIKAVIAFQKLPEAESLAAANKRVNNILKKQNHLEIPKRINEKLLELDAEQTLSKKINEKNEVITDLITGAHYASILEELSQLKEPVDKFFEDVMILDENKKKRDNRLALLMQLRKLFIQVADISLL